MSKNLDAAEARRFWLTPAQTVFVSCGDDRHLNEFGNAEKNHGEVRKLFANIAARGHLEFRKPSAEKTAPRYFSLMGAIKFRVMSDLIDSGRDYDCAGTVGEAVAALVSDAVLSKESLSLIDKDFPRLIAYTTKKGATDTWEVKAYLPMIQSPVFWAAENLLGASPEVSIVNAGQIICSVVRNYGFARAGK